MYSLCPFLNIAFSFSFLGPTPRKGRSTRGRKAALSSPVKSPSTVKRRTRGKSSTEESAESLSPVKRTAGKKAATPKKAPASKKAATLKKAPASKKAVTPKKAPASKKAATPKKSTAAKKTATPKKSPAQKRATRSKKTEEISAKESTPVQMVSKRGRKSPSETEVTPAKKLATEAAEVVQGKKTASLKVSPKKAATKSGKRKARASPTQSKASTVKSPTPAKRSTRGKTAKASPKKSPGGKPKRGKLTVKLVLNTKSSPQRQNKEAASSDAPTKRTTRSRR